MLRRASAIGLFTVLALPGLAPAASLEGELDRLIRGAGPIGVHVSDARTRRTMFARRSAAPRPLTSLTKLFTGYTALEELPATVATTAVATAPIDAAGTLHGDLVLLGGGDPTFGSMLFNDRTYGGTFAAVETLANAVVARGLRRVDGAVVGDESLFDAQRGAFGPIERALDGSLSALAYNRGRSGDFSPVVEAPAIAAAAVFNDLLEARSVTIGGTPRTGAMAGPGSVELGAVRTTTRELARIMLREDDHFVAEMLGKRLAAAVSIPATTAHATELLQRAAGSPARFHDTAGVHPRNRATPSQVGSVLRGLNRRGDRTLLPMLGTRSVQDRGISALARKRCRAVSTPGTGANIAGLCVTRRGGMVAFAILGGTKARRAADRMVAAIARR